MTTIVIDGKEHRVRFTLRALREIEQRAPAGIMKKEFEEWAGTVEGIGVMLWAGLLHEMPDASVEDVEGMVEMSDIPAIGTAISEAFSSSMPPNAQAGRPPRNRTPR